MSKMDKRFSKLFQSLYCTLTTSQIQQALVGAGLTHKDWMEFIQFMKNTGYDSSEQKNDEVMFNLHEP